MAESSNAAATNESSNTAVPFTIPHIHSHIAPKLQLDEQNYMAWVYQFQPILRTNDLMGIVDGTEPCPPRYIPGLTKDSPDQLNPEFIIWEKKDQYLLSWLIATLSEKVISTVYGLNNSRQVWSALANRYAAPSKTRIQDLRRQLQILRQGDKTCADYVNAAKSLADQLTMVGKPVLDEDLISYLIGGLNPRYNAFITSFTLMTKDATMSLAEFQTLLLSHEQLLNSQDAYSEPSSFAMHAQKMSPNNRKPRFTNQRQNQSRFPNQKGKFSSPQRKLFNNTETSPHGKPHSSQFVSDTNRPPCQICGKTSHQALDCFHRMDYAYQGRHPPSELAAMVSQSNALRGEDEWLADSGANNHITAELENLSIH
jgi:hypothetical protein